MPAPKGGPANNPNGRPRIGEANRVTLTARVDASTMEWLKETAAERGLSLGRLVDLIVLERALADIPELGDK